MEISQLVGDPLLSFQMTRYRVLSVKIENGTATAAEKAEYEAMLKLESEILPKEDES